MKPLDRYADWLIGPGVQRGLIGPKEADRIWERHIDNCLAVVEEPGLVPVGSDVIDVGSGAGLPGLVWALARPDLAVTLVEPLERRTAFLHEVIDDLKIPNARVVRGRAQEVDVQAAVVTARAVAPLSKLAKWCAPLTGPGGRMVFLKGTRADDEVAAARAWLGRTGWTATVSEVGVEHRARVVVLGRERME